MVSNVLLQAWVYRDGEKVNLEVFMNDNLDQDLGQVSEVPSSSPAQTPAMVTMTQEEFTEKMKARVAREREKWEAQQVPSQTSSQGKVEVDPNLVDRLVEQKLEGFKRETEKKAYEATVQAMAHKVLQSYKAKMESGKEKYSDFDEQISNLKVDKRPALIQLAEKLDNTADVMYELAKNKAKAIQINAAFKDDPEDALELMMDLSKSIKANENAKSNFRHTKSLSQIKPSSTAVDNGRRTISDLRKLDITKM